MSVRLSVDLASKLRQEAASRHVGFNALVRELMTSHANWRDFANKVRPLPVPADLLVAILGRISDKEIADVACDSGKNIFRQLGPAFKDGFDVDYFLELMEAWLGGSGMEVHRLAGPARGCTVSHDLGRKWSIYLAGLAESIFDQADLRPRVRFSIRDDSLTLTIPERHHY